MHENFFAIGKMSVKSIIKKLFYLGAVIIAGRSFIWGRYLFMNHKYHKEISYIEKGQEWHSFKLVNNLPLALVGGIVYFFVILFIWKLICELLYIIFMRINNN